LLGREAERRTHFALFYLRVWGYRRARRHLRLEPGVQSCKLGVLSTDKMHRAQTIVGGK